MINEEKVKDFAEQYYANKNFRKCNDIAINSNVALCIDNIQIEGNAKNIGQPKDNKQFCDLFRLYHETSEQICLQKVTKCSQLNL